MSEHCAKCNFPMEGQTICNDCVDALQSENAKLKEMLERMASSLEIIKTTGFILHIKEVAREALAEYQKWKEKNNL